MLVGREPERARIEALIEAARGGEGGGLILVGEPGIGKSALLDWAIDRAGDFLVLTARGLESESELAFGGLALVLRPVLDRVQSLPAARREALLPALELRSGPPSDRFSVYSAVLDFVALLSDSRPLLVVVDDVQWLDGESREALGFVGRRLASERAALLLAARRDPADATSSPALDEIVLSGLEPEPAAELAARSVAGIAPGVVEKLIDLTGGNPLALEELPSQLTEAQLQGTEPLPDPLPAGPRIDLAFGRRLDELDREGEHALLVAAASDSGDLAEINRALEALGREQAALEAAEDAGLVALKPPSVAFRHPLLRSAVYHRASEADRRSAHRAIADVIGGTAGGRHAWHLAASAPGPDEGIAAALERTAVTAQQRGAPLSAARALEVAANLSPEPRDRARRLLHAATLAHAGGRANDALDLLSRAAPSADEPDLLDDIERARCIARFYDADALPEVRNRLVSLAASVEPHRPDAATLMRADVAMTYCMSGQIARAVEITDLAIPAARRAGGEILEIALITRANSLGLAGRSDEALAALEEARALRTGFGAAVGPWAAAVHGGAWIHAGHPETGRDLLVQEIEAARRQSIVTALPVALALVCEADYRRGDWLSARAVGAESFKLASELGQTSELGFTAALLARVDAGQGRVESCRQLLARASEIADRSGAGSIRHVALAANGLLELGLGRFHEAIEPFARLRAMERELGIGVEAEWFHLSLVDAYLSCGRRRDAERAAADLEDAAQITRTPWTRAAVPVSRGMLADDSDFDEAFAEGLRVLDAHSMAFERARARLLFGERLRRAGRELDAREQLRAGLAIFDAIGAAPWARRARLELEQAGERPPRSENPLPGLTPQELQVAVRVSEGMTNREVAAALFVTVKTIEAHLRSIYRKLEIRSRTDLTRLVVSNQALIAAHTDAADPDEISGFSSMR